jgi:hypothetical protein
MKPHLFGTSYYDGWLLLATPTDALPTVELDICAALAPEQARWAHNTWHVVHSRVWLFFSLWRGCTSASCAWARIQSNDEGLNELNCGCDCIPPPARCHPPVAAPVPCHPSVVIGRRIVDPPSNNVSTDHHTFDSRLSFLIPSILTSGYQLILLHSMPVCIIYILMV